MNIIRHPHSLAARSALAFAIGSALTFAAIAPQPAHAQVNISFSVDFAPPILPVYEQPIIPGPGYLWTPGYWAWDTDDGYFWVPGTWVRPPYSGALWTPGYWGWREGLFVFVNGYWGPRVGYYGGINYGYGYTGIGYAGGYWRGSNFFYNRTVNNITNVTNITNVYTKTVINHNTTINRTSFNGPGGTTVQANASELAYQNHQHTAPVAAQLQQMSTARSMPNLRAAINKGAPPIAATSRPGIFDDGMNTAAHPNSAAERYRPGNNKTTRTSRQDAGNPQSATAQMAVENQSQQAASQNRLPPPSHANRDMQDLRNNMPPPHEQRAKRQAKPAYANSDFREDAPPPRMSSPHPRMQERPHMHAPPPAHEAAKPQHEEHKPNKKEEHDGRF
jgi:hypothetical protein